MPTRLSYDKLFRFSDQKRIDRSATVKGPPLEMDPYKDAEYYAFNFKSHPSTTGLRHRGYIKFFRPRSRQPTPMEHLQCVVDCTCPDFRYRWAWANKQRGSSAVGPRSLNQAHNRAPRITNPTGKPGLCKHILAARHYIYGILSSFTSDQPDTSYKFDKLLRYADKRWADFPGAMAAARARDRELRARAQLRNVTGPLPPEDVAEPEADIALPEPPAEAVEVPTTQQQAPELPNEYELPPPDEEGGETYTPTQRGPETARKKGRIETGGFPTVAQRRAVRYGESKLVVMPNGNMPMNDLKQAIALVEDILDDAPETYQSPEAAVSPEGDFGAPDLPPSEPPISDSALGADTEGASVVGLLTDIRDTLQQLVAPAEGGLEPGAGGEMMPPAGGEAPPVEGEAEGEEFGDLGVPEPELDAEEIAASDAEEATAEEGEDEDEDGGSPPPFKKKAKGGEGDEDDKD